MSSKRSLQSDSSESDSLEPLSARCVVLGSHLTSGGVSFLLCKMGSIFSVHSASMGCLRNKWDNECGSLIETSELS